MSSMYWYTLFLPVFAGQLRPKYIPGDENRFNTLHQRKVLIELRSRVYLGFFWPG